jgi:WD40 repeat protein
MAAHKEQHLNRWAELPRDTGSSERRAGFDGVLKTFESSATFVVRGERGALKRILVALVATAVLLSGWTPSAAAAATTLPLTNYGDMVVDPAHGHVFVTGGIGNSSVVVLDFSGTIVKTITGQDGAAGLVIDESSSTLYVALYGSTQISRISTETLSEVGRFSVAPGPAPYFLASAGGRLWFSGCGDSSGLASITPAGADLRQYGGTSCLALASSPTDSSLLAVAGIGGSPAIISIYDVSADPPSLEFSGSPPGDVYGPSNLEDMAVTPDGLGLLVACGYPYFHQAVTLSDLTRLVKYESTSYPNSVAASPDGQYVAGGANTSAVFIFESGNSTATRVYPFPAARLYPRGLAFSPNGRKLFATAEATPGSGVKLHVLSNRLFTTLTLAPSKSVVKYGGSLKLTAHLSPGDTENKRISIYATPHGGTKKLVKRGDVDSDGNLQATVRPTKRTTYTATFAGDETYEAATSDAEVVLVRVITTAVVAGFYGTSGRYKLYHFGQLVKQTGTVVPNHAGKRLKFVAQLRRSGAWRTVATGSFRIRDNGSVTAFFTPGSRRSYRVRNEFAGDKDHLGDVSPWRYVKVTR